MRELGTQKKGFLKELLDPKDIFFFKIGYVKTYFSISTKKKSEGELEDAFRTLFNECAADGITYEYFDFHRECAKMRYDRLSLLMDQLSKYNMGFFCASREINSDKTASIIRQQTGVFRTNCMDCLDRTNVVQSMLAAENLVTVLSR